MLIPAEEVGLFDIGGGVAVPAVSVLVVVAPLSQHRLVFRYRILPADRAEADRTAALLVFS